MIGPPFHTGVVVTDIDGAMRELGDTLGISWASVRNADRSDRRRVWTSTGVHNIPFIVAYARRGPARIELIEAVPDTPWSVSTPGMLHHVGYWTDDLLTDARTLERRGFPLIAHALAPDESLTRWTYHANPYGGFVELVDVQRRASLRRWWTTGKPE
jgi:hypothetical protein